ncbi:MAG TPA: DUF1302 family protein, partial [Verrucomicrobiae bacterium]|nr:DUF1302 family protein [Verrucomicrobiae bacterium]
MHRRLERMAFTSALLAALAAGRAAAIDFELGGDVTGSLRAQVAIGAGWRANDRKVPLVGKLNLPGQEQFCEDKDPDGPTGPQAAPGINCQTVAGNAAFLALPGYPSVNFDNGNLNYDRGDLVAAAVKLAPRLQLTWNTFGLDVSGLWFYDPANTGFTDFHQNNRQDNNGFQERNEPRRQDVEDQIGTRFELLDAYLSGTVALPGDRALTLKLGNQILSIGTSTLL